MGLFKHEIAAFQNDSFGAHNILKNKNDFNKKIKMIKTIVVP